MNNKILVVVAHRDDEVFGVGGTIKKYSKNGGKVYCLYLGDENLCRENGNLNDSANKSAKILGIEKLFFEDLPDNKFDSIPLINITQKVEKYVSEVKPDIIYTHYENDVNADHRLTYEAVMTACRPCNNNCPKEIYSFEVLSSTEWQLKKPKFNPNFYIDIKNEIEDKIKACKEYKSEFREYPHSRSYKGVKILAQYRGLECGKEYAEAFKLIRGIK